MAEKEVIEEATEPVEVDVEPNDPESSKTIELSDQELALIGEAFDLAIKSSRNSMQLSMNLFPIGNKLGVYRNPQQG